MADGISDMLTGRPYQQPLLGILGGLGPLATVDFLGKLTRLTPADRDQQHLPWLALNQPGTPDRSESLRTGSDAPSVYLTQGVAYLAAQGVRLIAIPCNTSHFWFEAIQAASSVPVLHIAEAAIERLDRKRTDHGPVAVLATRGTVNARIYSSRLRDHGLDVFPISEPMQHRVDSVILDVKKGKVEAAAVTMQSIADSLAMAGLDIVILACTELPIVWQLVRSRLTTIDTSLTLAQGCLRRLGYLTDNTNPPI